jgi:hypothetical protein
MGYIEEMSRRDFMKLLATFGLTPAIAFLSKEDYKTVYGDIVESHRSSRGYILKFKEFSGREYNLYFNPSFCDKGPVCIKFLMVIQ